MHILIITSEYGAYMRGGLGSHVQQLTTDLASLGVELTIGLATHECVAVIEYQAGHEHWLSIDKPDVSGQDWHDGQMTANQQLVDQVIQLYPVLPFDLIHTHDWLSFPAGRQLAQHGRQPQISTVHVLQAMIERAGYVLDSRSYRIEAQMCAQSDHVIAVSNYMREQICALPGVQSHNVSAIHNWLDPDQFTRESAASVQTVRRQLAPNGEQIVLFVGRLSIQKGVEFLLESSYRVLAERPHTRWVVV